MNVEIKKAVKEDIDFLFYLRNQPGIYKYFKNPYQVKHKEHINWIMPILKGERKNIFLYLIYYEGKKAGQLRFNLEDKKTAEVSISLMKEYFGKGIAKQVINLGIEKMKDKGIEKIVAEIKKENNQSIRFFKKYGFKKFEENQQYRKYRYLVKNSIV